MTPFLLLRILWVLRRSNTLCMHIALEARSLSLSSRGIRTYTQHLVEHLLSLRSDASFSILQASSLSEQFPGARCVHVPLYSELLVVPWLLWQVPAALRTLKPDLVHFTKADVPRSLGIPTVVTVYDVIPLLFPASQTVLRRWYWPGALRRAVRNSDQVITISEASKRDIVRHLSVSPDQVTVTPLAIDHAVFRPVTDPVHLSEVRRRWELPERYILFVGTRDPRKNCALLVRAFAALAEHVPHHLVIAGRQLSRSDAVVDTARRGRVSDRVHVLGAVSSADLPALYSGADLFVWPSAYEGWGFPPQEAMACGTPVIVSDGGSLPEVVGTAGEIVSFAEEGFAARMTDRHFERQLSERMGSILHDESRRIQMREQGLARVQQFTWDAVARQTMGVYQRVLAG